MMAATLLDSKNPTFDRVEVTEEGHLKTYDYAEFMNLDLAFRIRLILAGSPKFFLGSEQIEKKKALALG